MKNDVRRKFHELQLKDVVEMQSIREASAEGKEAREAIESVIGGNFNLSPTVARGVAENDGY